MRILESMESETRWIKEIAHPLLEEEATDSVGTGEAAVDVFTTTVVDEGGGTTSVVPASELTGVDVKYSEDTEVEVERLALWEENGTALGGAINKWSNIRDRNVRWRSRRAAC
jgi:hypothetical protein